MIIAHSPLKTLLIVVTLLLLAALFLLWRTFIAMPGRTSLTRVLPDAAAVEQLRQDVAALAGFIGERNLIRPGRLESAEVHIVAALRSAGLEPRAETFDFEGERCANIVAEVRGSERPEEIVVVGAHYDTVVGSPVADDNASGVAVTLALARLFRNSRPHRTLRFVFFTNEEPPHFQSESMGSYVYARKLREKRENVTAMLSIESVGYFRDARGSQAYPAPMSLLYPSRGNFIAFVGDVKSRALVRRTVAAFRTSAPIPSEGAALPDALPGIGWSDQWSFWQFGYPAVMVTDTALFRNPNYHTMHDTPDTLDYSRMALLVTGLESVVRDLCDR